MDCGKREILREKRLPLLKNEIEYHLTNTAGEKKIDFNH